MIKSINYSKIILSLGMIVFVASMVVAGTGAFFSDTETSTGNIFAAGALDLKVDSVGHINGLVCFDGAWASEDVVVWNDSDEQLEVIGDLSAANTAYNNANPTNVPQAGDPCESTWELTDLGPETFFSFSDLKPGDEGENTISLHVLDNDAYACAIIDNMQDDDNGLTEPEEEDGDTTGGDGEGELSQELRFFAWDDDGDNIWEDGESVLFSNTEGPASDVIDGVVYPLFTPDTGALLGAETEYIGLYWCYGAISVDEGTNTLTCDGSDVTNMTQTDSLMADFTFYVEQARNNDDFECPVIEPPVDDRDPVGAAIAGTSFTYEVPTSCDFTVPTDYATPALAVADAGTVVDGSVVCVDTGTYGAFVVDRPLTFVGLNDPSGGSAAVITPDAASDHAINIGADNVTIKGLKIDGAGTDFTGDHIAGIRVLTDIPDADISGTRILQNVVTDLHHVGVSGARTAIGIQLFAEETGLEDIVDVDIMGNHVSNIKSDTGGAHGMQVVNDLSDVVISENTVEDIDGAWETGVAVDGNNPASMSDVMITRNQLASASFSVQVEANAKSDEVFVNTNNLGALLYGGSSAVGSLPILDATSNWWGTPAPALGSEVFVNPVTNVVDFSSPEASAFPLN